MDLSGVRKDGQAVRYVDPLDAWSAFAQKMSTYYDAIRRISDVDGG